MRAIARRVGTSLSNLYNYYSSKEALLCEVLSEGNESLYSAMKLSEISQSAPPSGGELDSGAFEPDIRVLHTTKALRMTMVVAEYSLNNPVVMRVALTESRYLTGTFRTIVDDGQRQCITLLRDAILEETSVDNRPLDPHYTARAIMVLTANLPLWLRSNRTDDRRQLMEKHQEACSRLLGAS